MRIHHFGDSFDIVKQSLLRWLGSFGEWRVRARHQSSLSCTWLVVISAWNSRGTGADCTTAHSWCFLLFDGQRPLQRTIFTDRLSSAVTFEQLMGPPGMHPTYLSPFAFQSGNHHALVACRLMPHPGNGGGFRSLLNRDTLCSGDRATADRRGMIGDCSCHSVGKIGVFLVKAEERDHRTQKVFHVLGLGFVAGSGIGLPSCPQHG